MARMNELCGILTSRSSGKTFVVKMQKLSDGSFSEISLESEVTSIMKTGHVVSRGVEGGRPV